MPNSTAELIISCKATGQQNLDKVNQSLMGMDGLAKRALGALGGLFATHKIIEFGKRSIQAYSDLQETTQKFGEVFKGVNKEAERQAEILEEKFGASSRSARSMLSLTGDLLTGFGFGRKEALELSAQVAQLGSDIASFSNYAGGAEGATIAITKAMLGETEMAKMLGISIKTDSEEYKKLYKQIKATKGTTDSQTKAWVAYLLAAKQKGNALGDFERNINSIANQSRLFSNEIEELMSQFGAFINDTSDVGKAIGDLGKKIEELSDWLKNDSYTLSFALQNVWLDISTSISMFYTYTFKPIVGLIINGFKNIVKFGEWCNRNISTIFKGLANSETNIFLNFGKDVAHNIFGGLKLFGASALATGEGIMNVTGGNKLLHGKNVYSQVGSTQNMLIDWIDNWGKNTENALNKMGVSSKMPELKLDDDIFKPWISPVKTMDEMLSEYNRLKKTLEIDLLKKLDEKKKKNDDNANDVKNAAKTAGGALDILAKHINSFRDVTSRAISANSEEGIRMQSRRLLYSGANMKNTVEENSKKSVSIQQGIKTDMEKIVAKITDIESRISGIGFTTYS